MLVTWKLRESPSRLIRYGAAPAISVPFSRIDPRLGQTAADRKEGRRPAPFGPLIACRSPPAMSSVTPRMIEVAPSVFRC
jgi:hypothetical protein